MAGVPKSKGCDACRKQKKKCDQKKPSCSRCARLLIKCVGTGVRRIKFEPQAFQVVNGQAQKSKALVTTTTPRPAPTNGGSRLASRLVSMFEVQDMRYSIYNYGLVFTDLPRHIGCSPALDASVAAIIAAFDALHNRDAEQEALVRNMEALAALSKAVEDPIRACSHDNMCAIYILNISQGLIKQEGDDYPKHGQILSQLLRDVAIQGRLHEFDPKLIRTFCATSVIESFYNRKLELGQWFWDIFYQCLPPRPIMSSVQSLISVRLDTTADIAIYLRSPERYLHQIRLTYDIMQSEYDILCSATRAALDAAAKPDSTIELKRMGSSYIAGFGVFLILVSILNRVLRIYDANLNLLKESDKICNDTVVLAKYAQPYRPLSAAVAGNTVLVVWASRTKSQKNEDLDDAMRDYVDDFDKANYMGRAWNLVQWYDKLEKNCRLVASQQHINMAPHVPDDSEDINDGCIIM